MTNLIQLSNTLKNLSDEQLQQEMDAPSGSAPPFLVLAERNRREEMRKSYEGEQRRRGEGKTTVAEDVMGSQGPTMAPGGQPAAPLQTGMPAFANGGSVGIGAMAPQASGLGAALPGAGYGGYLKRIEDMLGKTGEAQASNRAMAILEAGLGIASGRSPDFATNVGQGGLGALQGYRKGQGDAQARELGLLTTAANLSGKERAEAIQLMEMDQRGRIAEAKAVAARAKGTKPTQKDKQIETLMNRGWSRKDAEDVAYGVVELKTDETGKLVLVDKLTRESREIQSPDYTKDAGAKDQISEAAPAVPDGQTDPASKLAKPETLWNAATGVTGMIPALQEGTTRILGQITDDPSVLNTEVVEKRQKFRTAFGGMARALSINPRMPVAEIRRIQEEVKIEPSVFDSEPALRARMRSLDSSLTKIAEEQESAGRDNSLAKQDRLSARANARAIRNFLSTMGVPKETELERELRRRGRL